MMNTVYNKFSKYSPYINDFQNSKRSAVTIPLVTIKNETYILLEVRSNKLNSHPNEICLPGGKIENSELPLDAAIRETCEELGIPKENINVISPLDLLVTPFNSILHPYLIEINDLSNLKLNKSEVYKIFYVPLSYFINNKPDIYSNTIQMTLSDNFPFENIPNSNNYKFDSGRYDIMFYKYNEYIIWGITAKILNNFIENLIR